MVYEDFDCPICANKDFNVLRFKNDKMSNKVLREPNLFSASSNYKLFDQLVKCKICGHVMTNPRLSTTDLIESYSNSTENNHFVQNKFRIDSFEKALKKIIKKNNLKTAESELKVLDIGCASGAFLQAAKNITNWNLKGIEPSIAMVKFGNTNYGLDITQGVFAENSFPNEKFDIISLWDVLEHVNHPDKLILEISNKLKINGILIINVPNLNTITARVMRYSWPFYLAVHIHYFKDDTLKKLLANYKLQVISQKPYFQKLGLGYVFFRAANYIHNKIEYNNFFKMFDNIPIWYNMGQTTFIARLCH